MEHTSNHFFVTGHLYASSPSANITSKVGNSAEEIPSGSGACHGYNDVNLFSSSLPVLPHKKYSEYGIESTDYASSKIYKVSNEMEHEDSFDEFAQQVIGTLLPDDEDELLAGIVDDFDLSGLPSQVEELEECDLFGSGGDIELDTNPAKSIIAGMAKIHISDNYVGNGTVQYNLPDGVGIIAGEHPYGEHPSRTLFVRNISSNVEDSELRSLFEQYGEIRSLYTACKHRGFVMISYYDIRAARTAMRALQNKPLQRRKLDIHFSIPKVNPSDKDLNQGTLVVFNLDPSVSHDDLRQIFGAYGEVKEIRETPHKRQHKFIEFYDVRAAEAALRSLNRSDIAGKRIKLEPSRPGGARRNLMQQLSQELEHDETRCYRPQMGSPITNSPPGTWAQFGNPNDNRTLQALKQSPTLGAVNPVRSNHLPGLASILPPMMSNSVKIAPIGNNENRVNHAEQVFSPRNSTHGVPLQHSHSFLEHNSAMVPKTISSSGTLSSFGSLTSNASRMGTLTGSQFLWHSPTLYTEHTQSAWPQSSMGHSFVFNRKEQSFPHSVRHSYFPAPSHHVGSAPSGIPFERHFGYFPGSPKTSIKSPVSFGNMSIGSNEGNLVMDMGVRGLMNPGLAMPGNASENGAPGFSIMSSQRFGPMVLGNDPYIGYGASVMKGLFEGGQIRQIDNGSQSDSKKQYQLNLDKIISGEDTRTTLMIKNIPNKYTSKMLLAALDENHRGTYDFLYLPIDFKNKCNVGYAFINMLSPSHIISFYQAFNGKKWGKFNSEKIASFAYAWIQGKAALVAHFQNSSLMNEDISCCPILFNSEGPEIGDQEPFIPNHMNTQVLQQDETYLGDTPRSPARNKLNEKLDNHSLPGSSSPESPTAVGIQVLKKYEKEKLQVQLY